MPRTMLANESNQARQGKQGCNVLHNRCDCMNRVHGFANKIVPELLESLATGFKLTVGYQFYSKDKERLQAIIDSHEGSCTLSAGSSGRKGSTAYLRSDEYNIYLEIQDNYPVKYHGYGSNSHSCDYYKKTVYLWDNREGLAKDYVFLPLSTHSIFDSAKTKLASIEAEISQLQDQIYPLKRLIGER